MASDQQMVRIGPIRLFLTGKALDSIDPGPGIQGRLLLDRAGSDATLCRLARAGQHCHVLPVGALGSGLAGYRSRSEEHTSELQSLMRISYAVFCLKKKKHNK